MPFFKNMFSFTDRIGRSMPNLNKIRGKSLGCGPPGGAPNAGTARGGAASHRQPVTKVHQPTKYGLSSRNHHNSDPRMGLQNTYQNTASSVPSRGTTVVSRDVSLDF